MDIVRRKLILVTIGTLRVKRSCLVSLQITKFEKKRLRIRSYNCGSALIEKCGTLHDTAEPFSSSFHVISFGILHSWGRLAAQQNFVVK